MNLSDLLLLGWPWAVVWLVGVLLVFRWEAQLEREMGE